VGLPKGFKHSEATKLKMSRSHRGVKFTDERRANHRVAAQRREANRRAMEARLREYERREAT
jgi:NUMOD3 motif